MAHGLAKETLTTEQYNATVKKAWDRMPPADKAHLNAVLLRFDKSMGLHGMSLTDKLDLLAQIGAVLK